MAYGLSNGHVTDDDGHVTQDVTWPRKVLWGSTIGYPSDSLASCVYCFEWTECSINNQIAIVQVLCDSQGVYVLQLMVSDTGMSGSRLPGS